MRIFTNFAGKPYTCYMEKNSFAEQVREVVCKIPKGKTLSYMKVAALAGNARAARAVGQVMKNNHDPSVPCHRVIRTDGTLGGYNRGGIKEKKQLLEFEKYA